MIPCDIISLVYHIREFISKMQRLFNIFLGILFLALFAPIANAKDVKFIQISDLQFSLNEKSVENYDNAIKKINETKDIDFVIFTGGNLAYSDEDLLKKFLKMSKKIKYPYYIQIGTNDCQKNQGITKDEYKKLLNKYSKRRYKSFNYYVKKDDLLFVFVDGSKQFIPTTGYYKTETVQWLDKTLTKFSNRRVVIFQYFPLYNSDLTVNSNLYKPDIYFDVLKKHKNVIAIFSSSNLDSYDLYSDNVLYSTAKPAKLNSSIFKEVFLNSDVKGTYEIYSKNVSF